MKLNFWQWLGLILLVIGLAVYAYEKTRPAATTNTGTAPAIQPTR
jgi:hypothetical protein